MTNQIRAVVVDPNAEGRLSLQAVDAPTPARNKALIRVHTISLNRGEVRNSGKAEAGVRPGWDLAGTVEQSAADGSGPQVGSRVVGFVASGAWAELVNVPTNALAVLPPEAVTFAQAATLPVAGLTALYGLDKGGNLLQKRVLITGASGGVGYFGVQLAATAGAIVTAHIRNPERESLIREAGAQNVAIGDNAGNSADFAPFELILDGVAGKTLTQALPLLSKNGIYMLYGSTPEPEATFNLGQFFRLGGATLYGFILFHEVIFHQPASIGLQRLVNLVASGKIKPLIDVEASIEHIGTVAQQLMDRAYVGKAVLHFVE